MSGNPLRLLAYCLYRESTELFGSAGAEEAIEALNLTPGEYREAAEELESLRLVIISGNVNHPSGIARTPLQPKALLSAAPALLRDVDLPAEIRKLFDVLPSAPKDQYLIPVSEILERTVIPLPQLDLILRALEDLGFLVGRGTATDEWGSYMDIQITPSGRRVLRGDDPLHV